MADTDKMVELFAQNNFDSVIHLAAQPGARYSVDHPETLHRKQRYQGFSIFWKRAEKRKFTPCLCQ